MPHTINNDLLRKDVIGGQHVWDRSAGCQPDPARRIALQSGRWRRQRHRTTVMIDHSHGENRDCTTMEELKRKHKQGLWFWFWESEDWRKDWPGYRNELWG
jgi:hypothetical protein